jgi:GT2 family glycosyltransferase
MDLSIIIVNYNTKKLTLECIDSIRKSNPRVDYEIIAIDNGSTDPLDVSEKYKLVKNRENLGFSKAVNQGIKVAKGKSVLLLNSDTKVKSDSIDELYNFAESHPDAGAVGPKLLNSDGSVQPSCYHFPTLFGAIRQYWFGEEGVYEKYIPEKNEPSKVDALVMAAFLITSKALSKVTQLNEKYFMYFEDLDFARSIKKAGLNIYYDHKSEVSHIHGASGKEEADDKNQWRRLIPSSKLYHGKLIHSLINFVLWTGQKFGSLIPISLLILLIFPTFSKLFQPGFFPMQDDLQAFRVYEMDKCFTDLQIPCRWVPDAGYQYGYPQFNFYPPLPYYLGAVLHRVGIQYIDSVKILFILGYILSAITMYVLVTEVLKDRWSGFIAALAYSYIPYKAVEVYVRGALSEFWAQIFFPLILWAIYRLVNSGKTKYLIWLSLSIFFLMTTHVLMTMIFIPVAVLWAVFWVFQSRWKNFGKILFGGVLGFGLSAFFVLPVLFERQFVHTEGILSGYFDYRQHFVNLYKLFISREWGYGSSGFPNEKLNLSLGIIQWITGLLIAPVLAIIAWKRQKKIAILIIGLVALTLASIFMIHMKSSFIWAKLPILWYMQFPWRFLALSIFLLCILCGFVTYFSGRFKYIVGTIFVIISFGLTISFYVPKAWLNIRDTDKFSGISWEKQLTISIFDYLPIYATLPPPFKAPDLPEIVSGDAKFSDYKKGSNYQIGQVDVLRGATLRLPLFDFPGMTVKVDGKSISHINNDCSGQKYCLGLVEFNVSPGRHMVEVRLTDTPIRKIGNIITVLSFAVIGFATFWSKRNEKASF